MLGNRYSTTWGTEVFHQRQSVLPAKINELDMLEARVKVYTCGGTSFTLFCRSLGESRSLTSATRIHALMSSVEIDLKVLRKNPFVQNALCFDETTGEFLKSGGLKYKVPNKVSD